MEARYDPDACKVTDDVSILLVNFIAPHSAISFLSFKSSKLLNSVDAGIAFFTALTLMNLSQQQDADFLKSDRPPSDEGHACLNEDMFNLG